MRSDDCDVRSCDQRRYWTDMQFGLVDNILRRKADIDVSINKTPAQIYRCCRQFRRLAALISYGYQRTEQLEGSMPRVDFWSHEAVWHQQFKYEELTWCSRSSTYKSLTRQTIRFENSLLSYILTSRLSYNLVQVVFHLSIHLIESSGFNFRLVLLVFISHIYPFKHA